MQRTMTVFAVLAGIAAFSCMVAGSAPDSGGAGGGSANASCVSGGNPCDGCCSGSDCKAYSDQTYMLCGVQGARCAACEGSGSFCDPFIGCTADPASRWNVWAYAADVMPTNGAAAWDDDGGLPDVFVDLYCPSDSSSFSSQSEVATDTLMPRWASSPGNCVMTVHDMETMGFSAAVFDDDGNPPVDVIVGQSTIKPSDSDFARGWFTASGGKLNTLWLKLDKQ